MSFYKLLDILFQIPDPFHCPTSFKSSLGHEFTIQLPNQAEHKYNFVNSEGLAYECAAVSEAIKAGMCHHLIICIVYFIYTVLLLCTTIIHFDNIEFRVCNVLSDITTLQGLTVVNNINSKNEIFHFCGSRSDINVFCNIVEIQSKLA